MKHNVRLLVAGAALCCFPALCIAQNNDFLNDYNEFRQRAFNDYNDFRSRANEEFVRFMKDTWTWFESGGSIELPKLCPVPPVTMPEDEPAPIEDNPVPFDEVIPVPEPSPAPEPTVPVEDDRPIEDPFVPVTSMITFDFYGIALQVRFDDAGKIRLKGHDEKDVADFWSKMSRQYVQMLTDCVIIRRQYALCDWAYYIMTRNLSVRIYGEDSNGARMLHAFLLNQTGFKLRIARSDSGDLYPLLALDGGVFGHPYYNIDGVKYYMFDGYGGNGLYIFDHAYPGERALRLEAAPPDFPHCSLSDPRNLHSRNPEVSASVASCLNLIAFYNDYPNPFDGDDTLSRWRYYANTPPGDKVKEDLYPVLQQEIAGKSERDAANVLINFVQTAFVYGYDDEVWGEDRAFFADETIYYPYSDCEDRAILFTRLVRDLMGLEAVLLYYPNHLASAVCFNENIPGDCLSVDGKRYLVCDPTYINAPVGCTMPGMDNSTAKVIKL